MPDRPSARPALGDPRPKVLFVINSLAGGGAERVMLELAIASRDHAPDFDVSLVLLDDEKREYDPPGWLCVHQLDARNGLLRSVIQLRALIGELRPVAVLSFLTRANVANVILGRLMGFRSLISERVNTSNHFAVGLSARISRAMVRWSYPRADRVIAVSRGIADDLRDNFGVADAKLEVIANPVNISRIREAAWQAPAVELPGPYIVAISRLTKNKNAMLVVEALAAAGGGHSLVLLGQGPEHDAIAARAHALGIADRVIMPGFVSNPYPILRNAACYVSGSNAEGFPNGLVEALALGVPAISTNCPSGPSEVLDDRLRESLSGIHAGRWGIIVPQNDPRAMARAIEMILEPDRAETYARTGPERAEMFSVAAAAGHYWSVIRAGLAAMPVDERQRAA